MYMHCSQFGWRPLEYQCLLYLVSAAQMQGLRLGSPEAHSGCVMATATVGKQLLPVETPRVPASLVYASAQYRDWLPRPCTERGPEDPVCYWDSVRIPFNVPWPPRVGNRTLSGLEANNSDSPAPNPKSLLGTCPYREHSTVAGQTGVKPLSQGWSECPGRACNQQLAWSM